MRLVTRHFCCRTASNRIILQPFISLQRPKRGDLAYHFTRGHTHRVNSFVFYGPVFAAGAFTRFALVTKLAPLSPSPIVSSSHRRRRSSAANIPPALNLQEASPVKDHFGATSGLPARGFAQPLPPIPGTPQEMTLSRSPSPRKGGGWSSPGLNTPSASGRSSPRKGYGDLHINGGTNTVTWASAKAKSDEVNGYPAFSIRNNGFFARHARSISGSLPRFNLGGRRDYAEKEKLGRGRWHPNNGSKLGRLRTFAGRFLRRMRLRFLLVLAFVLAVALFYVTRKLYHMLCGLLGVNMSGSHASSIPKGIVPWRRKQICGDPGSKSRRGCNGVERCKRMGN